MIATVQLSPDIQREIIVAATEAATARILDEVLLTIQEAADTLKVSTATLNRLPIQRVKLGGATRYRRQDILSHIQASLEN
jgi:predicted DNA-binding protein (UPF0251 family)